VTAPLMQGAFTRLRNIRQSDFPWIEGVLCEPVVANAWRPAAAAVPSVQLLPSLLGRAVLDSLIVRRRTEEPVGIVQAHAVNRVDGHASLSVAIAPALHSTGWPVEGVALFADFLFCTLGLHKIYFEMTDAIADRTRHIGRWLSFEGCLRERAYHDGSYQDIVIYALYRSYWEREMRFRMERMASRVVDRPKSVQSGTGFNRSS
jgi:hypothetical protein